MLTVSISVPVTTAAEGVDVKPWAELWACSLWQGLLLTLKDEEISDRAAVVSYLSCKISNWPLFVHIKQRWCREAPVLPFMLKQQRVVIMASPYLISDSILTMINFTPVNWVSSSDWWQNEVTPQKNVAYFLSSNAYVSGCHSKHCQKHLTVSVWTGIKKKLFLGKSDRQRICRTIFLIFKLW